MATKKTVQKANQLEAKVDINISSSSKTVRADEYRSVYVNNVQFGFSRFDFQVICAQNIVSRDPAYKDTLKETVSLLMTPAYAKAFVGARQKA